MKKTMILAATILSLGAGAALAGDGDVNGQPATISTPQSQVYAAQHRLFSATSQTQTSVYGMFRGPGYAQGGEQ